MAIPDKDAVSTLVYGDDGGPFVVVVGKTSVTTLNLEYGYEGSPVVAAEGGGGSTSSENYIMIIMT